MKGVLFALLLLAGCYWPDLPGLIKLTFPASLTFMAIFVFSLKMSASKLVKRCVNYLGRVSYCLYMAQFTTIPVIKKFQENLSIEQEWIQVVVSTLLFAVITYHLVEVVAYRKTKEKAALLYIKLRSALARSN